MGGDEEEDSCGGGCIMSGASVSEDYAFEDFLDSIESVDLGVNDWTAYVRDESVAGSYSEVIADLDLDMCIPEVPGGIQQSEGFGEADSYCSAANYNASIHFWWRKKNAKWYYHVDDTEKTYDKLALILNDGEGWDSIEVDSRNLFYNKEYDDFIGKKDVDDAPESIPISESALFAIGVRCLKLGDCGVRMNWIGQRTSGLGERVTVKKSGESSGRDLYYDFTFECLPYEASSSTGECPTCGKDGLPCSEYKCKSLGKHCEYIEVEGIDSGGCVDSYDSSSPTIWTKIRKFGDTEWIDENQASFEYNDKIELEIITDEISKCRFNLGLSAGGSFSGVENRAGKEYGMRHLARLIYPGQKSTDDAFYEQEVLGESGGVELFIYCQDLNENFNLAPYLIRLNISSPPDRIAPQINRGSFSPANGGFVSIDSSVSPVSFNLNENSKCKWSMNDEEYSEMNNSFVCVGSSCNGALPIHEESNIFYIRCLDENNNSNAVSTRYVLSKAGSRLQIESISPTDLDTQDTRAQISLRVITNGGARDEECEFKISGYLDEYTQFNTKSGASHIQELDLPAGRHVVSAYCQDSSGDSDTVSQVIRINQDADSPLITRAYRQGNSVVIKTKEPAYCAFDYYSCSKEFGNMTLFIGTELEHKTSGKVGKMYYIKCKDPLGNLPPAHTCSKIVRG